MPDNGTNGKEGDPTPEDTSGTPGAGDPSPNGQDGLTQEQVNELVGKARQEGRTTGQSNLLKEFGFEDMDAAKEYLSQAREKEDAEKSEMERLQSQIEKANARAEDAENATKEALLSSQDVLMRTAVEIEIVTNEELSINPQAKDDIWTFLLTDHVGEKGIHVDENGKVQGVGEALKDLIKAKPYLASTPTDDTPGTQTRTKTRKVDSENLDNDTVDQAAEYNFPKL